MTLNDMLVAQRESLSVPTKREAGIILAEGGWSVFPVPNNQKFDAGIAGLSYLSAVRDGARFAEMADAVMHKHECHDVNVALCPGKCEVPLICVDLDGVDAMWRFYNDAQAAGHIDLELWLRVNTTRADLGRHMYFVAPEGQQWSNSTHVWGGDVRSGRGHVMMPPSTTETGRYTWAGEKLYVAPAWVLNGLRGSTVKDGGTAGELGPAEVEDLLERLSQWGATGYGRVGLNNMLDELRLARAGDQRGGRNPALSRTINRVMDLSIERHLNALEAINEIADEYVALFDPSEGRNPLGEVIRCVNSWVRNHETAVEDADMSGVVQDWANARGSGEVQTLPDAAMVTDDGEATTRKPRVKRRNTGWKDQTNK